MIPHVSATRALARVLATFTCAAALAAVPVHLARAGGTSGSLVVQSWSGHEGLPSDEATAVLQTRDGYVWIATSAGLARFDGERFRVFEPEHTPGLRSGNVSSLLEARDGTLWFTTADAGVGAMRDGRFVAFAPDSCLDGAQAKRLLETPDGSIWISTSRGLARWRRGTMAMVAPRTLREPTLVLADDRAGGVWTSTRSGVAHVTEAGVKTWRLASGPDDRGWWQPFVDRTGRVWLATQHGMLRLEGGTFVPFEAPGLPAGEPWRILYDDPGSDWPVFRSAGAYARFRDGAWHVLRPGPMTLYKNDPAWDGDRMWVAIGPDVYCDDAPRFTSPSQITGLMRDREGNLWVATANDGVFRLAPSVVALAGGRREGLNRVVTAIGEESGTLWLTTLGEGIVGVRDGREWTPTGGYPKSLYDLLPDGPGHWFAATPRGVERLTLAFGQPVRSEPVVSSLGAAAVLGRDRAGTLWAGTDAGIVRVRGGVTSVLPESLTHTRAPATVFACDGAGRTWIGTQGAGLLIVEGDRVRRIGLAEGLPGLRVASLAPDGERAMWVGLSGAGLAHVELPGAGKPRVAALGRADGLPSASILSLLAEDGHVWMGTPDGLAVLPLAAVRARLTGGREPLRAALYDERDGMLSRRCVSGARTLLLARDGRVWFATRNGAAGLEPARALASPPLPPPLVEEVTSGGREAPSLRGVSVLASDQRDLVIHYTALSFRAPARLRFRYRMLGVDRDWVEAGDRREAFYTHLPAGTHRFEVSVGDRFGRWSPAIASRAITLRPAFHETWGFRLLVLLALLALWVPADRWRVRRYRRRQDEMAALVATRTRELEVALAQIAAQTRSLEDLDRAKSRFFANISHEFRTPLTLTLGPLEDVLSGAVGDVPGEIRTELDVALRNSRRLLRLVNEILDLAKLESGRLALAAREEDVRTALGEWAHAFHPLAERKRITFEVEPPDAPLPLWFDRERLGKAFTNLLSNAFKFTPEGGTVTLRAARTATSEGERLRIDVIDTGPGIPAAERERIFERFYQVDESRRRLTPGTGIGLALARELTELHGGRITVESEPERGATFTMWLKPGREHLADAQVATGDPEPLAPIVPDEAPAATAPAKRAPAANAGADADVTTVLVVDDNAELRALVRRGLAARYRVIEASDGDEALATARASVPDLVVSDVMMPGMDGFELVSAFRADPELDHVPVVLLTARAESEDRIAGLQRGADDYVEKPFSAEELGARVDNLIAGRRRLRERYGRGFRVVSAAAPAEAADRAYLERLREVVGARLGEEDFGVAELAEAMRQDRTQLFRRVRELLGIAPAELLRASRLERASELLADGVGSVGEVAYATGFRSVSHFSQVFRGRFGATPSAWAKRRRDGADSAPPRAESAPAEEARRG